MENEKTRRGQLIGRAKVNIQEIDKRKINSKDALKSHLFT